MPPLTPLLDEVRGMFSDQGIERVPVGKVYELTDWIPDLEQATVRQRGRWTYQSTDQMGNYVEGLVYAPYKAGHILLALVNTDIRKVPYPTAGASTSVGSIPVASWQNPVFHRDRVIIPISDGSSAARYVTYNGSSFTVTSAPATALAGRFATIWKDRLILACSDAEPSAVVASKPGDPTAAFDSLSKMFSSLPVTGLAGIRSALLVFHGGSVERIRGTVWPDSTLSDEEGDLILESLFDGAGCYDASSIAYWQENVIFANGNGIWITDGTLVRNMTAQGGVLGRWRYEYQRAITADANFVVTPGGVYGDYYVCTIGLTGSTTDYDNITFLIHIPSRSAFIWKNVDAQCYATTESVPRNAIPQQLLAGTTTRSNPSLQRVINLTPCFEPDNTTSQTDANSVVVLPTITTPWFRMSKSAGLKRVRDVHVSYLASRPSDVDADVFDVKFSKVPDPDTSSSNWITAGQLRTNSTYRRNRVAINRPVEGLALKLVQLTDTKDARLYDISAWVYAEEATRLKSA